MRAVFAGIVDYAGLFPPAGLGMNAAVDNYQRYLGSQDRAILGRFVVPTTRLLELNQVLLAEKAAVISEHPWRLSATLSGTSAAELALLDDLLRLRSDGSVRIEAVELKVASESQIKAASDLLPGKELYLELPSTGPFPSLMQEVGRVKARAKFRTGGTEAGLFPAPMILAEFITAAVAEGVAFKFTAGLHHAWRGMYPLTYLPQAEQYLMFGFIPLLLATAEALRSGDQTRVNQLVTETDRRAIEVDREGLHWQRHSYSWTELMNARNYFSGFGSCSFIEPVQEIQECVNQ